MISLAFLRDYSGFCRERELWRRKTAGRSSHVEPPHRPARRAGASDPSLRSTLQFLARTHARALSDSHLFLCKCVL